MSHRVTFEAAAPFSPSRARITRPIEKPRGAIPFIIAESYLSLSLSLRRTANPRIGHPTGQS